MPEIRLEPHEKEPPPDPAGYIPLWLRPKGEHGDKWTSTIRCMDCDVKWMPVGTDSPTRNRCWMCGVLV